MADLVTQVGPVSVANLTAAAGVTTTEDGWWPCLDITFRTPVPTSITKITAQVRERGADGRYSQPAETVLTKAEIAAGEAKIVNGVSVGQHLEIRLNPAGAPGLPFQATPWVEVTTSWDALMAALGRDPDPDARPTPDLGHGYTWTRKDQIIQKGGVGSWNESLVEVPTVFWDPKLGKYRLLFDGYTGAQGSPSVNAIGYATSDDLATWTEYGSNPFFQRTSSGGDPDQNSVGQPFCVYEDGTYYLFYVGSTGTFGSGTQSICLATSTDFSTWTRHGSVVTKQASTWRSSDPARPCIVKRGAIYYMFFHSGLSGGIGYATSRDLLTWTVDDANSPIISKGVSGWDSGHIGDVSVYRVQDTWYALYYGETSGNEQKTGIAFTSDADFPLGWTKFSGNPVLVGTAATYDAGGAARGGVVQAGGRLFFFYTAASVAASGPDVSSTWSIAYAVDETLMPVSSGGVSDGDKGDLTVSSSGSVWTIDNDAVTYAKMQNVSAASRLLGRGSAGGAGDPEEIALGAGLSMSGTTLNASGVAGSAPYAYTHPPFGNVSALLHCDGTNGSTTITDETGGTWTAVGTAAISTAQSVFGGASLLVPGSGNSSIRRTTSSAFDVGTGDWSLEFRWRYNGAPQAIARVFATRDGDTNQGIALTIDTSSVLSINMSSNGSSANVIASTVLWTMSQSAWHSVIIQRRGGFVECFLDGTLMRTFTIAGASVYYNAADSVTIGGNSTGTSRSMNAYIDEFRFTKGFAVMVPGDPGLPTSALPDS